MRPLLILSTLLFFLGCTRAVETPNLASAFDATLTDIDGKPYPLAQHRGKVVMVVNVAPKCGFTGQYAGLESLYLERKERGLVVIGVPSNDFGVFSGQEPGEDAEIKKFCTLTYGVTFPMMTKVKVSGKEADPFFRWLITRPGRGAVSWNFNKFLIGRDGTTIRKFGSSTAPNDKELMNAIDAALAKP